jgi:hypothetical protein
MKWVNKLNRNFSKENVQLANKYMKKCSTSRAIKKMEIKTIIKISPHSS